MAIFLFAASTSFAGLTLEVSGDNTPTVTVDVMVDQATNIAGAAFTVKYPSDLGFPTVSSEFFETFIDQGFDDSDGLNQDLDGDGTNESIMDYSKPLVDSEVTLSGASGVRIAAARYEEKEATPTGTPLFSLKFEGTIGGPYAIELVATKLDNTQAGYDPPTTIDLLVGADSTVQDPSAEGAFPVRLARDPQNDTKVFASTEINIGEEVQFTLDIDGDNATTIATDGVMILRSIFNLPPVDIVDGVTFTQDSVRNTAEDVGNYLAMGKTPSAAEGGKGPLDIDADGQYSVATDGVMILRSIFNLPPVDIVDGVEIPAGAERNDATSIGNYLQSLKP
jgi:hypothetical protein